MGVFMYYTLHTSDNGTSFTAKKGDRVVVALEEVPNAQEKWIWQNHASLELVDESKKTETNHLELRVFRFGILDAATDVTFTLENPYKVDEPAQVFKFSVTIG